MTLDGKTADAETYLQERSIQRGRNIVLASIGLCFGVAVLRLGIHAYVGSINPFPLISLCVVMLTSYGLFHGNARTKHAFTVLMTIAALRLYLAALTQLAWPLGLFATCYAVAVVLLISSNDVDAFLNAQRELLTSDSREQGLTPSDQPSGPALAYCDYCEMDVMPDDDGRCQQCNWPV